MGTIGKAGFDPKAFLARADVGRTIFKYRINQIVFSQGDLADSVFYIHLKSDEFSSVFLRFLPFGDGRQPTAQ